MVMVMVMVRNAYYQCNQVHNKAFFIAQNGHTVRVEAVDCYYYCSSSSLRYLLKTTLSW